MSGPRITRPTVSCLSRAFVYRNHVSTDVAKTWAKFRPIEQSRVLVGSVDDRGVVTVPAPAEPKETTS